MIETTTINDKAKVKKWLQANSISYIKNDIGDESYTFFIDSPSKIVTIPDAQYTVKVIKTTITMDKADKEDTPIKQPEADNIEPDMEPPHDYSKLKFIGYIGIIFGLITLYFLIN